MKTSKVLVAALSSISLLGLSACVTDPNTGERKISRTGIGAVLGGTAGYLLGDVIGGSTARIIGAGIGGSAGAVIGKQFDDQIRELDEATQGTGVEVEEIGDQEAILLKLPDGVTFAVNSATISPSFRTTLDSVAQTLKNYPNSLIDVYGFTDSTGSEAYNLELSQRRAQAVADYLAMQGVARSRMATQGYGENPEYFRASNDTPEGRALNRRVEIKITPISQEDVAAARAQ
ncbi:OmpA family protein [Altererythrobacter aurantiacus]|uniref:OmpA family protein n=1 Tax=Parapontixanthobacter aurantiacus TaxID=1463599 RepID=A0A844ZM66_9SPHN|nr:OmpA family protein [Parapontixanthobacter aurantiacus]MXO86749.1 OmpA family protein [Parapontixanthobacter aurantiacus]